MTEKNYNPEQKTAKTLKKQKQVSDKKIDAPIVKDETKKIETKTEVKKPIVKKVVAKKEFAEVNANSVPISTLESMYLCKFIKYKSIDKAMEDLELVLKMKKAVPMKGEVPHRRGMMSGRYPINSSKAFITILKGLKGNANVNGIEEPIISEAVANFASRPYGRFGRTQKKRTHIKLVARNKKEAKK